MEHSENNLRNRIIWLGSDPEPDIKREYEQRNLIVQPGTVEEVRDMLNFSRAVVISYDGNTRKIVRSLIYEKGVYQYGNIIFVTVPSNSYIKAQRLLDSLLQEFKGRLQITAAEPYKIAQQISNYDPGPSENMELPITGINKEDLLPHLGREVVEKENFPQRLQDLSQLLRRAFWDCERLKVTLLTGGKYSLVFRADVVIENPAGPAPLPFFVKFDSLKRIRTERDNYKSYVSGYIPFNHRPNIIPERCVEGTNNGLLVGNFVEHSEPLAETALRGTFTSSIYSLFHQAMRGWQAQAYNEPQARYARDRDLTLVRSLVGDKSGLELFRTNSLDPRVEQEVQNLGCVSTPTQLIEKIKALPPVMHLRGLIHGDLHAWNIHVRGTDAILIDFYRAGLGPLLWDPAALEVSMCFGEMFETAATTALYEDWRCMVKQLYHQDWIRCPLKRPNFPSIMEGICICISEIRLYGHGLEVEEGTYQQALAIQLLLTSFFTPKELQPKSWAVKRLAYAYFLAERLLQENGE